MSQVSKELQTTFMVATVLNLFDEPPRINKKTGEIQREGHRKVQVATQVQIAPDAPQTKMELVSLRIPTNHIDAIEALVGKLICFAVDSYSVTNNGNNYHGWYMRSTFKPFEFTGFAGAGAVAPASPVASQTPPPVPKQDAFAVKKAA